MGAAGHDVARRITWDGVIEKLVSSDCQTPRTHG
jgi:hypothetical protein